MPFLKASTVCKTNSGGNSTKDDGSFKYIVYKQPLSLDRFYVHDVQQVDAQGDYLSLYRDKYYLKWVNLTQHSNLNPHVTMRSYKYETPLLAHRYESIPANCHCAFILCAKRRYKGNKNDRKFYIALAMMS